MFWRVNPSIRSALSITNAVTQKYKMRHHSNVLDFLNVQKFSSLKVINAFKAIHNCHARILTFHRMYSIWTAVELFIVSPFHFIEKIFFIKNETNNFRFSSIKFHKKKNCIRLTQIQNFCRTKKWCRALLIDVWRRISRVCYFEVFTLHFNQSSISSCTCFWITILYQ